MTFGFGNGAMSAAFRVAFNDLFTSDFPPRTVNGNEVAPGKEDIGQHLYGLATDVCAVGEFCNLSMVASIVDSESIPFSEHKLGKIDILGIDPIEHLHSFNNDGSVSMINVALPGHTFGGTVVHTVRETGGTIRLETVGSGFGPMPVLNEFVGGILFGKMHADVMLKHSQAVQALQNQKRNNNE